MTDTSPTIATAPAHTTEEPTEHDVPDAVRRYEEKQGLSKAEWFSEVYQVEVDPDLVVVHTKFAPLDEYFKLASKICKAYAGLVESPDQRLVIRAGSGDNLATCS